MISIPLFLEAQEVLSRDKIVRVEVAQLLRALRLNARWAEPIPEHTLPFRSRDPKDDRLLACSLAGDADYLVTGDKDLLELVLNQAAFFDVLGPRSGWRRWG